MTNPLDDARQAVATSEGRVATLAARLATARADLAKLTATMAKAEDIDGTVESIARARGRVEVLREAESAEQERLHKYRRELADAEAKDAQAEAARLFEQYRQHDAALRASVAQAAEQIVPRGLELARLGCAVAAAVRRGGNGRIYACHQDLRLVGQMVASVATQDITRAFLEAERQAADAKA